jgi:hypothetical protein
LLTVFSLSMCGKGSILGLNRLQKPEIALMIIVDCKRLDSEFSIAGFES